MSNIPPTHVGDEELLQLYRACYPTIDARESEEFKTPTWGLLASDLGVGMQIQYDRSPSDRISYGLWYAGEVFHGWYNDVANPFPKPDFSPANPNPIQGRIRISNDMWTDDSGPINPIGVHAGDLFLCYTEGKEVQNQINDFANQGYKFVRFWCVINWMRQDTDFWAGRGCSPDITDNFYGQLRNFCSFLINAKLKIHMSVGDMNPVSDSQRDTLYNNLSGLVAELGQDNFFCAGEINESSQTFHGSNPNRIESLVNKIRNNNTSSLYALTGYGGNTSLENVRLYTPSWMPFYYYHGYRDGHWWDKVRHMFSNGYEYYNQVRACGYNGEDVGPGRWVSVTANKHELNTRVMSLLAAMAMCSKTAYNYFCSPGIKFDEPFENMPGYLNVPKVIAMLPKDLQTYELLHHSGTRWQNDRVFSADGETRIDGRKASDGRFCYVVYGPESNVNAPIQKNFEAQLIDPESLTSTPISGQAGNRLPGLRNGFILVGHTV